MKTKVWIVIWGLKDGGAETLAKEYARLVNKQAFEPTIVTMYPFTNTANYRRAKDAGIKIISVFKNRNILTRAIRLVTGKRYVSWILKRMLLRKKPDIIHFNSQMACWFAPLQRYLHGVNLLYTCHSDVSKYFSEKEENAVRQLIRSNNLRLIALHEDMRRELNRRFSKEDTAIIRNGVDLTGFTKAGNSRTMTRQNIGVAGDAYVVGHVGRLSKVKNHSFLLQVFQKIAQRKPNAHLLLIGSGDLKDEIIQQIRRMDMENRVTILAHRTDIPELLQAMDVMVFPSLFEGLSVTLVEAQASGLKCVISNTINPANILSPKTIPVSLDEPVEVWAEIALNEEIRNTEYGSIEDYDINREIHRLERLYQGYMDV